MTTASDAGTLIAWAAARLADAGIEAPRGEAYRLLAHASGAGVDAARLRERQTAIPPGVRAAFEDCVARRALREPSAFITGAQGFWTLDLAVSDATLIPRADSECLIESLLRLRPDRHGRLRLLDLGTGTGCLLLAALSEYPASEGVGIDLSERACRLAAANALRHGLAARARFVCACWSDALDPGARFDVVLGNPPYIAADSIVALMPEVARFEPRRALDGGVDGLAAYRMILPRLSGLLAADGVAVLELGAGQRQAVQEMAEAAALAFVSVQPDLNGVERALALRAR